MRNGLLSATPGLEDIAAGSFPPQEKCKDLTMELF
jgi:hypothetical protein